MSLTYAALSPRELRTLFSAPRHALKEAIHALETVPPWRPIPEDKAHIADALALLRCALDWYDGAYRPIEARRGGGGIVMFRGRERVELGGEMEGRGT